MRKELEKIPVPKERIEINGIGYIREDKIEADKNNETMKKFELITDTAITTEDHIIGLGSVQLNDKWAKVTVPMDYLVIGYNVLLQLGVPSIDLIISNDKNMPLIMGNISENKVNGIFIKPTSETLNDDEDESEVDEEEDGEEEPEDEEEE